MFSIGRWLSSIRWFRDSGTFYLLAPYLLHATLKLSCLSPPVGGKKSRENCLWEYFTDRKELLQITSTNNHQLELSSTSSKSTEDFGTVVNLWLESVTYRIQGLQATSEFLLHPIFSWVFLTSNRGIGGRVYGTLWNTSESQFSCSHTGDNLTASGMSHTWWWWRCWCSLEVQGWIEGLEIPTPRSMSLVLEREGKS